MARLGVAYVDEVRRCPLCTEGAAGSSSAAQAEGAAGSSSSNFCIDARTSSNRCRAAYQLPSDNLHTIKKSKFCANCGYEIIYSIGAKKIDHRTTGYDTDTTVVLALLRSTVR